MLSSTQCIIIFRCSTLWFPSHLILLASFFKNLYSVQIFDSYKLFLKVILREVIIRTEAKDLFLFELFHQDFFHLTMRQLSIVIQSECLNAPIFIFIKFDLVLHNFDSCLEDTFIFDGLSNHDFTGTSSRTLRWMSRGNFSRRIYVWVHSVRSWHLCRHHLRRLLFKSLQ